MSVSNDIKNLRKGAVDGGFLRMTKRRRWPRPESRAAGPSTGGPRSSRRNPVICWPAQPVAQRIGVDVKGACRRGRCPVRRGDAGSRPASRRSLIEARKPLSVDRRGRAPLERADDLAAGPPCIAWARRRDALTTGGEQHTVALGAGRRHPQTVDIGDDRARSTAPAGRRPSFHQRRRPPRQTVHRGVRQQQVGAVTDHPKVSDEGGKALASSRSAPPICAIASSFPAPKNDLARSLRFRRRNHSVRFFASDAETDDGVTTIDGRSQINPPTPHRCRRARRTAAAPTGPQSTAPAFRG